MNSLWNMVINCHVVYIIANKVRNYVSNTSNDHEIVTVAAYDLTKTKPYQVHKYQNDQD